MVTRQHPAAVCACQVPTPTTNSTSDNPHPQNNPRPQTAPNPTPRPTTLRRQARTPTPAKTTPTPKPPPPNKQPPPSHLSQAVQEEQRVPPVPRPAGKHLLQVPREHHENRPLRGERHPHGDHAVPRVPQVGQRHAVAVAVDGQKGVLPKLEEAPFVGEGGVGVVGVCFGGGWGQSILWGLIRAG